MAARLFHFKQFSINQDRAAMKIGIDGVVLGAWAQTTQAQTILDIGTGTGLLALMLAQRQQQAEITAIDIHEEAALQAWENSLNSPWHKRIKVLNSSLQDFTRKQQKQTFDLLICNPPFFNASFKCANQARNTARHTDTLSYEELVSNTVRLMSSHSIFALILPFSSEHSFLEFAQKHHLHLQRCLHLQPTPDSGYHRSLMEFSFSPTANPKTESMVIEKYGRHLYSEQYIKLTKDFYIKF